MNKYLIPLFLALVFLVVNLLTISDYGINWDGPIHMMRGQAYAHLLLTGKSSYDKAQQLSPMIIKPGEYASRYYFITADEDKHVSLTERPIHDKENSGLSFYASEAWNGKYWLEYDDPHLPLIDILSAFSNRLFYGVLGWLGDIESYQLVYILISVLGVFIVSLFAYELSGSWLASVVSGLSLGLFPIYFAESHINMKDPAQAVFFMGAVWAFWHWVKGDRLGRLGLLGWFGIFIAFVALALAVKWNIVFLPLILIPWLILIKFKDWFKLGVLGLLGGLGIIIFLIAIWPYAWGKPFAVAIETVRYYLDTGTGKALIQPAGFILPGGFNIYPILLFLTQTPEIILILGGIGVIWVIGERGGDKYKTGYLLLFWLLVPIIRLSFPGTRTYGGLRQILEFLPALVLLAGVGVGYLSSVILSAAKNLLRMQVSNKLRDPSGFALRMTLVVMTFVLLAFPIIRLYPNQNAYFNILAGGLTGAANKHLVDWTLTYGNIYKQGVDWLNEHAEKDANVVHLSGSDYAISPLWLRNDISISPYNFSLFEQKGEYIMALYNPLDPPVFAKRYPEKFLRPVFEVKVDGVSLLFIYKNENRYNLLDIDKEKSLDKFIVQQQGDLAGDFWQINLAKEYKITRIWVDNLDKNCSKGQTINELIFFDTSDPTKAFVLNEIKVHEDGKIEYDFPAEEASLIKIYPLNNQSCFGRGKIISVSYLGS